MDGKIGVERRKNTRYKAVNGAHAAVKPSSHEISGQIFDISMGGLSFKYTDTGILESEDEQESEKTIYLSNIGYHVGDISFKVISDEEIETIPSFLFGELTVKKKQIQFIGLDFDQMVDLDHYLSNNVSEPVK